MSKNENGLSERMLLGHKPLEITYCKKCNRYLHQGRYLSKKEFLKSLQNIIEKHIEFGRKPDGLEISTDFLDEPKKNSEIEIVAAMHDGKKAVEEHAMIPVRMAHVECRECSRLKGGYFEGTLQLRNKDNEAFNTVADLIEDHVYRRKNVAITKKDKVNNGIDFFLTDQKYMVALVKELHKKYGGETNITRKLHSTDRQSSKQVYRVTALLRLPGYNLGDIIRWEGELYKIISFSAERINAQHLLKGGTRPIKIGDAIEIAASRKDYIETLVIKRKPHVEILHPVTFESVQLANSSDASGKKLDIVIIDDMIYAV